MKNEYESGAHENSAQEQMQEQLCAYLLQELDAKDAVHVEQRLQESEVWRAERDRLSGTIGLVRAAMKADPVLAPEGEQLSEATLQHLALVGTQAAAGHGKGSSAGAVQASPMRMFVPVAATIAVALGGYWAFQKSQNRTTGHLESTANAEGSFAPRGGGDADLQTDPAEDSEAESGEAGEKASNTWRTGAPPGATAIDLNGLGKSDAVDSEGGPSFNIKKTGEIIVRKEQLYVPDVEGRAKDPLDDVKSKLGEIARNMPRNSELSEDPLMIRGDRSIPFEQVQRVMQKATHQGLQSPKRGLAASTDSSPQTRSANTSGGLMPPVDGATGGVRSNGLATGGDDWLLGKGDAQGSTRDALKSPDAQPAPKTKAPASSHGGNYRGPGDTALPAGAGGAASRPQSPGSAGPSSPGPGSSNPVTMPGLVTGGVEIRDASKSPGEKKNDLGAYYEDGSTDFDVEVDEVRLVDKPSAETLERGREEHFRARLGRLQQDESTDAWEEEALEQDLLLAMAGETPEEFQARTESLSEKVRQVPAPSEADAEEPNERVSATTAVDRFKDDAVIRESPEVVELRLRAAIAERAAKRHEQLIHSCLPKPNERPNAMYYRWWGDNPFVYTSTDRQATFAADVDTASYTLARRYLTGNNLPTREQIRTEEFVNYFTGDITPPTSGVFAVQTEMTASPFGGSPNRYMLRVGIRGKVVPKEERPPMALVFVVDTSGSMSNGNRMDLVKHSLRLLGTELDGRDQVGVVSFASEARLVLPMTSMDQRSQLESAVQSLAPDGSTNVEDGIRLGYELLSRVPADGRLRRVVLISDGVANTGNTVADEILKEVQIHRESGIYLSTVGVGMGNHNDALLERLANRGDGICDYVDDADAARRAMVERFSGGFIPIARDLKIQLEFDGKHVLRYRQLGYENRAVADADFRNDAVDGGEVGSGHQVTALFELECVDLPDGSELTLNDLGNVRLRYKSIAKGSDQQVFETEHDMKVQAGRVAFDAGSPGFARSVVAAQFAEVLRRSTHAAGDDYGMLVQQAERVADLPIFAGDGETQELAGMIRRAGQLGAGAQVQRDELWVTVDTYRKHRYLCGTEEEIGGKPTSERLAEIAAINAELEARIRELSLREALQGR